MKALLFGAAPDPHEARPTPSDELETMLAGIPFGLHEIDDAGFVRPDWVVTKPILSGICGSDAKLVLGDFSTGDIDNPMAAFSSLPHVPGHEVVAEVVALGPTATGLSVGQRVILNPWLSCVPRGIDPPCPSCTSGDLSMCWHFTDGHLAPGIHTGTCKDAPGGFADYFPAHHSMLLPVPADIPDEIAVLADPFSVSLHSVTRNPPPPGGRAMVYGAGALGTTATAILRALHAAVKDGQKTVLTEMLDANLTDLRSGDLRKAIRKGDKLVERIVEEAAEYTGIAVANLINIFSPQIVVLGGGVIDALGDEMMAIIVETAEDYALGGTNKGIEIVASKAGDDAGIIGGAVLARRAAKQ